MQIPDEYRRDIVRQLEDAAGIAEGILAMANSFMRRVLTCFRVALASGADRVASGPPKISRTLFKADLRCAVVTGISGDR